MMEPGPPAEMRDRARALLPRIAASADETERERRLPEPLVAALIEAGLFRLLLPRALGGAEVDPVTFVEIIEAIASADGSTAWVLCQTAGTSMSAAYLLPRVAGEIFGPPRGLLAWGPGAGAHARAADGGYRISGTFSFASGCRHAAWLGAHCTVVEPDGTPRRRDDGTVDSRTMIFPAASAAVMDVWDVIGLRGTGSDAYAVKDLFVPDDFTVVRDEPAERRHPGALYCFRSLSLFAAGFAGVALGIARTMMSEFVVLAAGKVPRGFSTTLRENAVVQSQIARAEARLRSARALLMSSVEESWQDVGRLGELTLERRIAIRLASTHAILQAKAAADAIYHLAGSAAIFAGGAFERRFRDLHAVTQQMQGRQSHFETVGRHLLGLEPDTTWL
ncbi:MAG: acyl-CoA dehydrogenase family protein [Candidatus Rokuibacteriota bacterium]